ncbi:retroviral-like aspartic protease family protein [Erythrobacter sp. W53]|uniref:retroviral-like aspartic protease family protein n=1 Tax=Erythrobacter sp. W53 TaxID=3425947 RepID=UPI003D766B4A
MFLSHSTFTTLIAGAAAAMGFATQNPTAPASNLAPPAAAMTDEELTEQIELDRDRYERVTVPVTIDGQGPYRFLVDTGAQATVVTNRIVDDLALERNGTATLIALGSSEVVDTIAIDGLEFANRRFNGITAPLLKGRNIGADGILGLDSLQDLRVLIDFRENRMTVADAEELGGNSGYEIVVRARRKLGQMIITNARINGVRTAVVIDTGAQNTIGNAALERRLRSRKEDEQQLSTDVHGTEILSDLAIARKLTIGGLQMNHVPIGFAQSPVFAALNLEGRPAMILGMNNLRSMNRVAIDFASQRILFDLPGRSRIESQRKQRFRLERTGTS